MKTTLQPPQSSLTQDTGTDVPHDPTWIPPAERRTTHPEAGLPDHAKEGHDESHDG